MNSIQTYLDSSIYSLQHILPEVILLSAFLLSLIFDLFSSNKKVISFIAFSGIIISSILTFTQLLPENNSLQLFGGMLTINNRVILFKIILSLGTLICFLPYLFEKYDQHKAKRYAEFITLFPILLLSVNFLCMSDHLLTIFMGIEFVSILSYIYIAYYINDKRIGESAVKYILFGAISSAVMLYGLSLLYGFTGTLSLSNGDFLAALSKVPVQLSTIAIFIFLAGFLYKISAVPFHYYAPDVYEGANPLVLSFISTLPKIAGFAVLLNFLSHFQYEWAGTSLLWPNFPWEKALSLFSILTMFFGNLSALSQRNLNRMMAYSSISHGGFLLIAFTGFSVSGNIAILFYSFVYLLMNAGLFFILHLWKTKYDIENVDDLKGIYKSSPLLSVCLVIILASLTGIPPFAGFIGKFLVFSSVFEQYAQSKSTWLLSLMIAGVVNTVIALFYYFKIILHMYFRKEEVERESFSVSGLDLIVLLISIALIFFGIYPSSMVEWFQSLLSTVNKVY